MPPLPSFHIQPRLVHQREIDRLGDLHRIRITAGSIPLWLFPSLDPGRTTTPRGSRTRGRSGAPFDPRANRNLRKVLS
jgi:hypothetical protein